MKDSVNCKLVLRVNERGYKDLVLVFPNKLEHMFYYKGHNDTKHLYGLMKSNCEE